MVGSARGRVFCFVEFVAFLWIFVLQFTDGTEMGECATCSLNSAVSLLSSSSNIKYMRIDSFYRHGKCLEL